MLSTFQIVLAYVSKIITNSRWFTGVEVHVFTTSLQLSFLEVSASFQNWMFLYKIYFRNVFWQLIPLFLCLVWVLFQMSKFLLNRT